jgi:hypothetical protein
MRAQSAEFMADMFDEMDEGVVVISAADNSIIFASAPAVQLLE